MCAQLDRVSGEALARAVGAGPDEDPLTIDLESAVCKTYGFGAVLAIAPAAIRPAGVDRDEKVFGLPESQIARRVKAITKAAGLADWEFFSGHSGRVDMVGRYTRGESAGSALRYL